MNSFLIELFDDEAIAEVFDTLVTDVVNDMYGALQQHSDLVDVLGASLTQVHLLAALGRYLEHQLPEAVVFARAQAWTFDEIGVALGVSGASIRHRYRHVLDPADISEEQ